MIASKREKNILFAVIGVIAVAAVYYYFVSPFMQGLDDIRTGTQKAKDELSDGQLMIDRQVRLQKTMDLMRTHGLKDDESQADTQLDYAMVQWSQLSGVDGPPELRREAPAKAGIFPIIGYTVQVGCSSRAMTRLMWALETATLPIRISSVTITPQREGTDSLTAHMEISTLSMPLADEAAPATPARTTQVSPNNTSNVISRTTQTSGNTSLNLIPRTTQPTPQTRSVATTQPINGGTSR